jgi:hypothetical protein
MWVGTLWGEEEEEEEEELHLSNPEGMMRWVLTHGKPKQEAMWVEKEVVNCC